MPEDQGPPGWIELAEGRELPEDVKLPGWVELPEDLEQPEDLDVPEDPGVPDIELPQDPVPEWHLLLELETCKA